MTANTIGNSFDWTRPLRLIPTLLLLLSITTRTAQENRIRAQDKTATAASGLQVPTAESLESARADSSQQLRPLEWDDNALELLAVYKHNYFVTCVESFPNGQFLLAGSKLTLWSPENNQPARRFEWFRSSGCYLVASAVAPNGKWFVVADNFGWIYRWELGKNSPSKGPSKMRSLSLREIGDIAISPSGKEISVLDCWGSSGTITTLDASNLEQKANFVVREEYQKPPVAPDIAVSNRIDYIAEDRLVTSEGGLAVWDTSGKLVRKLADSGYGVGVSNEAAEFYTFGEHLEFWNCESLQSSASLKGSFYYNQLLAMDSSGSTLAGINELWFDLWDLEAGARIARLPADIYKNQRAVGLQWLATKGVWAAVEQHGIIRIWGTEEAGRRLGLQPVQEVKIELPSANPDLPTDEVEEFAVLKQLPLPIGAQGREEPTKLYFEANANKAATIDFTRNRLRKMDWLESKSKPVDDASRTTLKFTRGGYSLAVLFEEKPQGEKTKTRMLYEGSLDLQLLPRLEDSIKPSFSSPESVVYQAVGSLLDIECQLLRLLQGAGWVPVTLEGPGTNRQDLEFEKLRWMQFLKDGTILKVVVRKNDRTSASWTIKYSRSEAEYSVPLPPDVGFVEYAPMRIGFVSMAWMTAKELKAYYDEQLEKQGWTLQPERNNSYVVYVKDQRTMMLFLRDHSGGRSVVIAGGIGGWQKQSLLWERERDKRPRGPATEYTSFERWLQSQRLEPGFASIDRYESEMRNLLGKATKQE